MTTDFKITELFPPYSSKHLYPFFICSYLLIFYYQTPRQQWKKCRFPPTYLM